MLRIAFAVYRQWGYDIFKEILKFQKIRSDFEIPLLILPNEYQCKLPSSLRGVKVLVVDPNDTDTIHTILEEHNIDIVCWYSWSWIVKKPILDDFINLCLHPSPLPKYRGGTPIQHQIINGEKDSAVTIFKMQDGIDSGPIYRQTAISFLGDVNDIFRRMVDVGLIMTKDLLTDAVNTKLKFHPQKNLDKYPPNKRRRPTQSEIKSGESMTFVELQNLVRGLIDPYPNAFYRMEQGKFYLQEVLYYKTLPVKRKKNELFLKVKDGFAKVVKSRFEKTK